MIDSRTLERFANIIGLLRNISRGSTSRRNSRKNFTDNHSFKIEVVKKTSMKLKYADNAEACYPFRQQECGRAV